MQIAVIGAGVIGLSVGTHLLQIMPRDVLVTVIADKLPPDTLASDRSVGLVTFGPHYIERGSTERTLRWVNGTKAYLDKIYNSPERNGSGISRLHGYMLKKDGPMNKIMVDGKEILPGWREANESEKALIHCNDHEVLTSVTYSIQSSAYMQWLLGKFTDLGGVVVKQKIDSLSTLDSYDIIVNCSGLGAKEVVDDENMYPLQGHVLSVKAPWVKQFFFDISTRTVIQPCEDSVIIGGMLETYNGDTNVDPDVIRHIREKAERQIPNLKAAENLEAWVGVRPMRLGGVRLERDSSMSTVVHCYGHGVKGYGCHWGCAEEVGRLVKDIIQEKFIPSSKL